MNYELNCKDWEIEVKPNSPFENDALNRQRFASVLNSIIDIYSHTGMVMSINGDWGAGKTTFVRMWRQQLIDNGYKTLYFNAWKTDFYNDALTSLLGELKSEFHANEKVGNVIQKGSKITLNVIEALIKGVLKQYSGIEIDAITAGVTAIKGQIDEAIDSYSHIKSDLEDFRKSLSELVESESNGKPVVFFIDELDRCKPDYAVQVLERIKHLFEVPNIAFVVSVNENQLQYAIQGFYGSNKIDGKEYLRRFFDFSFDLPTPDLFEYANLLYKKHNFSSFFSLINNNSNCSSSSGNKEGEIFLSFARDLLAGSRMNLRLANKIFAYTRLVLQGFTSTSDVLYDMVLLLCYLKVTNPQLFLKIKNGTFSIQNLVTELEKQLPPGLFSDSTDVLTTHHTAWAIAGLIAYYSCLGNGLKREPAFKGKLIEGSKNLSVYPIQTSKIDKAKLDEALSHIYSNHRNYGYGINRIIERIELNNYLRL